MRRKPVRQPEPVNDRSTAVPPAADIGRLWLAAIAALVLFPVHSLRAEAPVDGAWSGAMISSDSSRSRSGLDRQEICGFDRVDFEATVNGGRFEARVSHKGRSVTLAATPRGNGTVSLWFDWRIEGGTVQTKLEGRFSRHAFIGRTYGTYRSRDMRESGDVTCRANLIMAAAPLTVGDAINTRLLAGPDASAQEVLTVLEAEAGRAASRQAAAAPQSPPAEAVAPSPAPPAEKAPETKAPPSTLGESSPLTPQGLKEQLALLKELLDGGILTPTEFERRKHALLDRAFGRTPSTPRLPSPGVAPPQTLTIAVPNQKIGPTAPGDVDWGRYHALIIGINDYRHLPPLRTAVADAKKVSEVLARDYGFAVRLLLNPTRAQIVDALDEYRETLVGDDNLLIYYAGHGWLDEAANWGYWLPADAQPNRRHQWVSNATITDTLRTLLAKHVMIVADSCYSGALTRSAPVLLRSADYWQRISQKAARVTLTSGGLEPVADSDGSGHSPFASAFIEALGNNKKIMDGTTLFSKMRRPVMLKANQTPEYSDVRSAGHDGGDFVFVRQ